MKLRKLEEHRGGKSGVWARDSGGLAEEETFKLVVEGCVGVFRAQSLGDVGEPGQQPRALRTPWGKVLPLPGSYSASLALPGPGSADPQPVVPSSSFACSYRPPSWWVAWQWHSMRKQIWDLRGEDREGGHLSIALPDKPALGSAAFFCRSE